jgi:thiol-disulfide isomerase/thioredoxin
MTPTRRRERVWSIALPLAFSIASSLACDEPANPPAPYATPLRSDAELRSALVALCEEATAEPTRPVLIEFSAVWCSDCMRLHAMKQEAPLAAELSRWPYLNVNVGRFDRHRDLLAAMDIESIAHWSILRPGHCDTPVDRWPELRRRTLEVSSGEARNLTADDLARWLAALRDS